MMRQYRELKRRYPDYLLLFRLGDFYETFFEDAEVAARLLQITLTARQGAPMAGIPHQAADGYLARLVRAGRKIAISEQLETPGRTKKLLKRDVVRIITPGTITDTAYLAGAANNFLLAVVRGREARGVALLDVSTGEFWVGEDGAREDAVLSAALLRRPAEILVPGATREDKALLARLEAAGATLTFWEPVAGGARSAAADLCAHFQVDALDRFGVGDMTAGQEAAALALGYLRATQGDALGHLRHLTRLTAVDSMVLDATAVETLELLQGSDGGAGSSLFGVLDETVTAMGARLLRQWLLRPLLDPEAVAARQIAVAALVDQPARRARLRALLRPVGDLERLTSRAALGQAHGRGALRDRGAQGVRGQGARRRRASAAARVRAVRRGPAPGRRARLGAAHHRAGAGAARRAGLARRGRPRAGPRPSRRGPWRGPHDRGRPPSGARGAPRRRRDAE